MTYLLKYLKNYLKECIISPLFKLLEANFELIVPLIVARIVDKGISTADTGYIFQMGGILVLLAAIGLACSLTAQYFAAKAAVGFATDLRSHLFKHINTFSYYEIDKIGTSTLITRITNDVNQGSDMCKSCIKTFPSFAIYSIWCNDNGIYSKCKSRSCICNCNPASFSSSFRNYVIKCSPL